MLFNLVCSLVFLAPATAQGEFSHTIEHSYRVLILFAEVDWDYEEDYPPDYSGEYGDYSGSGEEGWEGDYDYQSGEGSGDYYEYETKYYHIPYCPQRQGETGIVGVLRGRTQTLWLY